MTLTVTEVERSRVANRKKVVLSISDSDGSGGDVDTGLTHITDYDIKNTTLADREPTLTVSSGSGTVTIGSEGSTDDVYLLTVYGW